MIRPRLGRGVATGAVKDTIAMETKKDATAAAVNVPRVTESPADARLLAFPLEVQTKKTSDFS